MNGRTVQRIGRYEIIREIARSNDIVYEAYDPQLKRRVAIKELLLPPTLPGEKVVERRERFYREARAAGSLQHPNIVTIYEVGEENGRHYMVMEYLEGQNLREILQVKRALPLEEVLDITEQVLSALVAAHSQGVIHRDIKPENIHILPSGLVKLTDFGIARIVFEPSLTAEGEVFGTPSYMSPEQIKGLPVDARTDIFSLGVVMYEMLSGRKPFTGDSAITIAYNILYQQPAPIPGIPEGIWRIIEKAMEKDPANRFQSAEEMLDALKEARSLPLAQTPITSPQPPPQAISPPAPPQPSLSDEPTAQVSLRKPRRFRLSEAQRDFLVLFLATVMGAGGLILFILGGSKFYEKWQKTLIRNKAVALYLEGWDYYNRGDKANALRKFREAFEIDRGNLERGGVAKDARRAIATIYTNMALEEFKAGRPQMAFSYVNQAIAWDEEYLPARLFRGDLYYRIFRSEELALQEWQYIVGRFPQSGEAEKAKEAIATVYFNRGVESFNRGSREEARLWWYKALTIAPGSEAGRRAQEELSRLSNPLLW